VDGKAGNNPQTKFTEERKENRAALGA